MSPKTTSLDDEVDERPRAIKRDEHVVYVVAILERKHDYRELSSLEEVWGSWRE